MTKKQTITVIRAAIFIIAIPMLVQCGPDKKPKTSGLPMKVANAYWPGMYWIDIAKKKGWFKEAGLNIEHIDIAKDYFKSISDMVEGKIDVHGFSLFDVIRYNLKGADLVLVNYQDTSSGSQAILAKKSIRTIKQLNRKRIGVTEKGYMEYILDVVLANHQLTLKDIKIIGLSGEKAAEIFMRGKLDAAVVWTPYTEEILEKGNARKLFDTAEIPGLIPAGSAFHRKFIKQRPGDVQAFVNLWHRTTVFMRENPKEAFGIIAKIYNKTMGEVQAFAQIDNIMDLRDNLTAFTYSTGFKSLHGAARRINNYMIKRTMAKEQLDSTDFLDARFIRALKRSSR